MSETLVSPTNRRRSRSRSKSRSGPETKPIRIWCPGSYDTLHFGHLSFLKNVRKNMLTRFSNVEVVVGLYSDQDLVTIGQPPVFTLEERFQMVRGCKWADAVCKGVPLEISKSVLTEYNCDYSFIVDDNGISPAKLNDKISNELLQCGILKTISKDGNSDLSAITTSHIVNRILLLEPRDENNNAKSGRDWATAKITFPASISCAEINKFATGNVPRPTDIIVYTDGSFDLLHPGHLTLLEKARGLGDFLYVGLHSDDVISKEAGNQFPVMKWNERLMALLSCKYVSEVVIDAPIGVDASLLDAFSVHIVVPSIDDYGGNKQKKSTLEDKYKEAKQRNIFCDIHPTQPDPTSTSLRLVDILKRVHQNWNDYSYVLNKVHSDVETDLAEVKSQNQDEGDVLKFSPCNASR